MVGSHKIILVLSLSNLLNAAVASNVPGAAGPGEEIRATTNRVLEILNDPKLKGENSKNARREKLRETIFPKFDFAEMGKRALGRHWARNPDKQREFISAFRQLLEESYADQIEAANANKLVFINERGEPDFAEVNMKAISAKGEETPISYKLHKADSEWKVYDVVIANISLVNNYRAQFNRVLANGSMDELIKRLKEKGVEKPS